MSGVVLQRLRAVADRRYQVGGLIWCIVGNLPNRTTSLALMALAAVAALACVSAIGAATTLVVMAVNDSEPAQPVARYDRECSVVAWKSGSIHCFRTVAQADPAR